MCLTVTDMKSPSWLKSYVEGLDIVPNTKYRSDCPVCSKRNTFSVTDDGLQRLWYCFHADCNVSGRTGVTLSKHTTKDIFTPKQQPLSITNRFSEFEMPDTFVSVGRSLDAELYLRKVGAYDAYLAGAVDLRYDVRMNRVVFLIRDGKKVVDAAGRSLDGRGPKWYRYWHSSLPFTCVGKCNTAVVVEDASSACSVYDDCTGVALLGTNLLQQHIDVLKQYDRVFIALDKDATDKAIGMVRTLHTHVPTRLMVLRTDLKNMERTQRHEFIRSYLD
jgi:hypothetical protein